MSDASVPGTEVSSDAVVTDGEHVSDSPVPNKNELIRDALIAFTSQATEQQKDKLLDILRNGFSAIGIQNFIGDCFVHSFGSKVEEKVVFGLYKDWCAKSDQYVHTKTDLYRLIE